MDRFNKKPIFIVGFRRGGSNLLLNLLRSHPNVCSPRGELHEVFKGKNVEDAWTVRFKKMRYVPIKLLEGGDVFNTSNWALRAQLKGLSQAAVDYILHRDKLRALGESQNKYKFENIPYTTDEIKRARILCKNVDGLIGMTPALAAMYPDATFIGLVRNGLALGEGHIRRGKTAEKFARNYLVGCEQMIHFERNMDNFHLIRFEDIVESPISSFEKVCDWCSLDLGQVAKIRLETKAVMNQEGARVFSHGAEEKKLIWYDLNEVASHFQKDANQNQIDRLSEENIQVMTSVCGKVLENLGYT